MICEEKIELINELAKYEKKILGIQTEYVLGRQADGLYRLTVSRGKDSRGMVVGNDFFRVSEFFRLVVESDTLPENLEDIESDITREQFL